MNDYSQINDYNLITLRLITQLCIKFRKCPVAFNLFLIHGRHHHQLGRHGEDLAPHLLQRAASGARGPPDPDDRGPAQPEGQPRKDGADHVRDVQLAGQLRRHPGRAVAVRLGPHHRPRPGLGRRRLAHGAHLRGLRAAARHPAGRPGWPRPHRLFDEDPDREGLLVCDHCRARNCP